MACARAVIAPAKDQRKSDRAFRGQKSGKQCDIVEVLQYGHSCLHPYTGDELTKPPHLRVHLGLQSHFEQSMRRMGLDGVVYRELKGKVPKALLTIAVRRNDPSNVVRNFLTMVRHRAKEANARS